MTDHQTQTDETQVERSPSPASGSSLYHRSFLFLTCMGLLALIVAAVWNSELLAPLYEGQKPYYCDRLQEAETRELSATRSVEQQINEIMQIQADETKLGFVGRVNKLKLRVKKSLVLLEIPLTQTERQFALVAMIDALTRLSETRDLYSREELLEFLPQVIDDFDPLVRRQAEIADAVLKIIDFMRIAEQNRDLPLAAIDRLLGNYPHDVEVANYLYAMNLQLIAENQVEFATDLMSRMHAVYQHSSNAILQSMAEKIPDRIRMAQVRLDMIISEMNYSLPAFERLVSTMLLLANGKPMGTELAKTTLWAAWYCEVTGKHSEANDIYRAIEENFSKQLSTPNGISAHRAALAGRQRINSLGNEFQLIGTSQIANAQAQEYCRDRTAIVVFWSQQNLPTYLEQLRYIDSQFSKSNDDQFAFVGYCVDANDLEPSPNLKGGGDGTTGASPTPTSSHPPAEFAPNWQVSVSRQESELLEKHLKSIGVPDTPYMILLKPGGVISAINVPPQELGPLLSTATATRRTRPR